jgi:hypothetical protein
MGLEGGPNGAKAVFRERFASAHSTQRNLEAVRLAHNRMRKETLVVVDGNVLMMGVPSSIDKFSDFVAVFCTMLGSAVTAAAHVVVVFDEPENITKAKQQTQTKRDATRSGKTPVCSSDLSACPTNDAYGSEQLLGVRIEDAPEGTPVAYTDGERQYAVAPANSKLLMNHRAARPRFHDAVCVAALEYITRNIDGNGAWSLSFDGVDARGADRPHDAPRELGVLSSDPELWVSLLAREQPVGEGDMKLTDVTAKVHARAVEDPEGPLGMVSLNLLWTIDTDSLLIELMQEARRAQRDRSDDQRVDANPERKSASSSETTASTLMEQILRAKSLDGRKAWCACDPPKLLPLGARCGFCDQYAFEQRYPQTVAEASAASAAEDDAEGGVEGDAAAPADVDGTGRLPEKTVLCLREPSRKRKGDEAATPAHYLCVDMTVLVDRVLRYLLGARYAQHYSLVDQRRAILLFAGGVLMCCCDFVKINGTSSVRMIEEVRELIRCDSDALAEMDGVHGGVASQTRAAVRPMQALLDGFIDMAAGNNRLRRQVAQASAATDLQFLRTAWTLAYWSGYEFKDVHAFGFAADRSSDA